MHIIECNQRELANLRALLRAQTRNIELAIESLDAVEQPLALSCTREILLRVLENLA